ncbi:MAG TPA: hypothetical protein ENI76_07345 [Ignavibacteria bacterium]|nr:hypothetical protein [Ignavibacteria bacterium]
MKAKLFTFLLLTGYFLLLTGYLSAQTVYEPLYKDVYKYLDRMAQKGVIELNDQIKPLTRIYIAEKLLEIGKRAREIRNREITEVERDELNFYLKDFGEEISMVNAKNKPGSVKAVPGERQKIKSFNSLSDLRRIRYSKLFGKDRFGRWHLFSYSSKLFKINLSPILGYQIGSNDNAYQTHRWNGAYLYGYLSDNIGFSFDFRDNAETGVNIDRTKSFTPVTGITIAKANKDKIEYSEIHTTLSTNWSWGEITVGKDFLQWGQAKSGQLVLSQKAPSFPFIRLDIRPTSWLRFNYIHGWLNSDVIDSNAIYATKRLGQNRTIFRDKYLASHTLTITPSKGLDISLGESIVYSDRLEVSYLMPLMFFRLADHYLSRANNNAGDNSQFFLGVSSRNFIKNTHLYGTLFIDEIVTEGLFDPKKQRNQFGFTLGGSVVDLPIENLTLTTEFTKIFPFVYSHYIPTQTYESSSYRLGHWMGNNADLIYGAINYRFMRGLQATIWGQYIRKGGAGTVDQQYTLPSQPFLFGLRTNYTYFGFEAKYEITYDLFARAKFLYSKVSKEQTNGTFIDNSKNEFRFALYYGL